MSNLVLVVDDNAANIFPLSTMLRQMGFEVDEAVSGVEAINMSCHKNYGLIFMDYLMPEMDGIQAIQQIQFIMKGQECPEFIGVSATLDEQVVATFGEVGVTHLIEKPIRIDQLKKLFDNIGFSVEEDQEENPSGQWDIGGIFSGLPGLNFEKGIDLMAGNVENYMKVLKVCVKNINDNYVALASIKDTSQIEGFTLHFHSLKGIFLNIGADAMAEESRGLELAAKDGRLEEIRGKLEDYMERISQFAGKIQEACEAYAAYKNETMAEGEISCLEFAGQLTELKQHIEDFEYIEITELLDQMLAGCHDERREGLEAISDAIQEFDYDSALEALERLNSRLEC